MPQVKNTQQLVIQSYPQVVTTTAFFISKELKEVVVGPVDSVDNCTVCERKVVKNGCGFCVDCISEYSELAA